VEFDIMYGTGISREGDLLDLGSENNIIEKSGAWFAFGGDRIGQGRENAKEFLKEHPEIYAAIEKKVLEHFGIVRAGEPTVAVPVTIEKPEKPANGSVKDGPRARA
jgi:recombination protein RecA